jgi:hypothetical protein
MLIVVCLVLAGTATVPVAQAQAIAATAQEPAGAGSFVITQHVVAGGGVARARSACFDLAGSIGQPVTGRTQGGDFSLDAGFWAVRVATDSIFRSSFEACQP